MMGTELSLEQFQLVLPKQVRKNVTPEMMDRFNAAMGGDPTFNKLYTENIVGLTSVMKDGKYKMESYLDAVKYVSFKMMGDSNIEAYTKTFPIRYQSFLQKQTSSKDIASYVSSYNKNKLVNLVLEQTIVPFHVINHDKRQAALDELFEMGMTASSEKVRSDSLNAVLTHTKGPEKIQMEIDVDVRQSSFIDDLRKATQEQVLATRARIVSGEITALDAAHTKLVSGEIEDAEIIE